jgi:hypothetical protein
MNFNEVILKIFPYLHSIRKIRTYLSFDLNFPETWKYPTKIMEKLQYTQNDANGKKIISFVCETNDNYVVLCIDGIESLIKYNLDREEKERLFEYKVKELKKLFDTNELDSLKQLKIDIEKELPVYEDETGEII